MNKSGTKKNLKISPVPQNLSDYGDLPIFKNPAALPGKEELKGPYICNPTIKLSGEERKILERDPKFSLMKRVEDRDFNTELERMLSKNRYNKNNKTIELERKRKLGNLLTHND